MKRSVDRSTQDRRRAEPFPRNANSFSPFHFCRDLHKALRARAQVVGERLPVFRRQLVVHIQRNFLAPLTRHDATPSALRINSRSCFLARASLDITVPIGISSASATSWYFISSISASNKTSLNGDDRRASACCTRSVSARRSSATSGVS